MELMVVVAIVGILATVAYPSYIDFVTQSKRTEAQRELLRLANLEEQYFSDHRTYTANISELGVGTGIKYKTESGNYEIEATIADSGASFILKANALGIQATNDADCSWLTVNQIGQKDSKTSGSCWEK